VSRSGGCNHRDAASEEEGLKFHQLETRNIHFTVSRKRRSVRLGTRNGPMLRNADKRRSCAALLCVLTGAVRDVLCNRRLHRNGGSFSRTPCSQVGMFTQYRPSQGVEHILPFVPLPRLITASEWQRLVQSLIPAARSDRPLVPHLPDAADPA
jgi:hypothetical protein